MKYCSIDGMKSSCIALGLDYIGTKIDEKTSFELMDLYYDRGGNHFDTAHLYCGGLSEKVLGKWVKSRGHKDVIIATKGAHPTDVSRLAPEDIRSDLEESLKRLGVSCIDLYWLHRDDTTRSAESIADTMNVFVREGKIKRFGCSNWKSERIEQANAYAEQSGMQGFCASQIKWSLAVSAPGFSDDPTLVEMDKTEYNFYKKTGMIVLAFASQGKGFFSKMAAGGEDALSQKAKERYLCDENIKRFKKLRELADEKGISAAAAALAYIYSNSDFTSVPIIGCGTLAQIEDSLSAADTVLSMEERRYLEE